MWSAHESRKKNLEHFTWGIAIVSHFRGFEVIAVFGSLACSYVVYFSTKGVVALASSIITQENVCPSPRNIAWDLASRECLANHCGAAGINCQ